ncbi:general secretory pathway protein GspE [Thermodesulfomicrobium sp. WS]|uniref:GspE/PulE family protein n=1 Tax=Thermodesulfomicrobium sp. WS TaxID=3004129 RepID=UPI002490CB0D|nr:GspE/PulE family protein [Thermodesulfomicrobium sp. WS]BDV02049.1 general secretory pathway protein GspE [Thermodesulfomicrobium sp. WS]
MHPQVILSLNKILLHAASFDDAWKKLVIEVPTVFGCEQVRLYRKHPSKSEVIARVAGKNGTQEMIALPFATSSIAGYTALVRIPILLKSMSRAEFTLIHSELRFDSRYDAATNVVTRNLISLPLTHGDAFLGVLQLVNKKEGTFQREDEAVARLLADLLARKMHEELQIPKGPFDALVHGGFVDAEALEAAKAAARQRGLPVSVILRRDYGIAPMEIGASLERYYQVPFVPFEGKFFGDDALQGMNRAYLKKNLWVPLEREEGRCVVLVHNPADLNLMEDIRHALGGTSYEFRVGLPEEILAFLGDFSLLPEAAATATAYASADASQAEAKAAVAGLAEFMEAAGGESVDIAKADQAEEDISAESRQQAVSFVNKMIIHAHTIGASDIHIEPGKPGTPGAVRMRVDGSCAKVLGIPGDLLPSVVSRIKIISGLNIAERRLPQDGKAKVRFKGKEIEMRVATLPTVYGESVVLRMLAAGQAMPFEKLNLSADNARRIEAIMKKPHGIFLVVGPTGSGKTTTLHAILGRINTPDKKIWTVEDPVEITQPGLQQVQVDTSIGLTFARIMRAFLRADPDVILVGEMRDLETAQIGVEASLTGHFVFSTLHTNSAPETLTRLLEMGIEPLNFSEALQGVLAQRLVKTLCSACKAPYAPSDEEWEFLVEQYGAELFLELGVDRQTAQLYRAVGCPRCDNTGYKGRTGIHELLVPTPEIRRAIARRVPTDEIKQMALASGMRTLFQDGIAKIFRGDLDILQLQKVTASDSP